MSYEFNPDREKLNFPNPFVVENYFLAAAAAVECCGALLMLLYSRSQLQNHVDYLIYVQVAFGVGLLLSGVNHARRAMNQLRFFFGSNYPASLATDLPPGAEGSTPHAEWLKKTLRQNAIDYQEPKGSLNGLLYSWLPNLIYSPGQIQFIAQKQFQNALAILFTLILLGLSKIGLTSNEAGAWMGGFFFFFSIFLLLRPMESGVTGKSEVGIRGFIVLLLSSIFGPVIITLLAPYLPNIAWLDVDVQTAVLLIVAEIGVILYFAALVRQIARPSTTSPAFHQSRLSINCHPKQLIDELDRTLQERWTEKIPNRRYCRISPHVGGGSGSFTAEMLEETQPMPIGDLNRIDLGCAFSMPRFQWIAMLDLLGLVLTSISVILFVAYALSDHDLAHLGSITGYLAFSIFMHVVGSFCLRAGHSLWGRFDFRSELVWVFMEGNYQPANMNFGNAYRDHINSSKQVISIETMTLRVWAAELTSVIFDKNSARSVLAIHGLPDRADDLARHVAEFAAGQTLLVTPTSDLDLQKMAMLGKMNAVAQQFDTPRQQALSPAPAAQNAGLQQQSGAAYCAKCGSQLAQNTRFCPMCGQPV